ncbi:MAG TPA: hypothetical protein VMV81_03500 [Phycisphaerae bacterium]|nr:hypothetical protein [Phycisphaerae bacterium]
MWRTVIIVSLTILAGCSEAAKPPYQHSATQPPMIMVHTADGWVEMPSNQAVNYPATPIAVHESAHEDELADTSLSDPPPGEATGYVAREFRLNRPFAWRVPRPRVDSAGPVSPTYYYVRPEQTPHGLIPGQYGRIDNYTPGQWTSHGYEVGHYRADGLYTRPEYTPQGFIPGHWRADPMPFGTATPAVTPSSPRR